ncbi:MAG TPA: hypothetical protein VHZ31_04440 [Solirubrobacteraceae bacterium]|nr:hypothetical protein [Solirubrobacteraceae bacterium]
MNDARITKTFALTGPINLSVRLGRGSVTVRTSDDLEAATVDLVPNPGAEELAEQIVAELVGPTLTIAMPREGRLADIVSVWSHRQRARDCVAVTVAVPTGTALKIVTTHAPVTVTGRCAGADITTGSGAITLDHVDGDLLLRYGSAGSRVERVSGSVTVQSAAGEARFGTIEGSLDHGCGRGLLDVREVHGKVRSRNGSGGARLAAVHGDVDLATGSGAMSIGLPAGATARVSATTGSGRVRSDLPIDDRPTLAASRTITVRALTGSGDIELFRAT